MRCSTVRAWNRTCVALPMAVGAVCCIQLASCAGGHLAAPAPAYARSTNGPAACPRDATRNPAGRCTCENGMVPVMGACVEPSLGDAFCGPAARMTGEGCVFRTCDGGQEVDLATGQCGPPASQVTADSSCPAGTVGAVASSRLICVSQPASCPRGTTRSEGKSALPECERGVGCPPGSLGEGATCSPIVFSRERGRRGRNVGEGEGVVVDLGAWTARVVGVDGGPGSPELCRPLEVRPDLFRAQQRGGPLIPLEIEVAISVPDQDVTQVHASASVRAPRLLPPKAEDAVRAAVDTLVELFRSLGGDATAASAITRVRCTVGGP